MKCKCWKTTHLKILNKLTMIKHRNLEMQNNSFLNWWMFQSKLNNHILPELFAFIYQIKNIPYLDSNKIILFSALRQLMEIVNHFNYIAYCFKVHWCITQKILPLKVWHVEFVTHYRVINICYICLITYMRQWFQLWIHSMPLLWHSRRIKLRVL